MNVLNGIAVSPVAYAAKSNDIGIIRHQKISCGPISLARRSTFCAFFSPIIAGTYRLPNFLDIAKASAEPISCPNTA